MIGPSSEATRLSVGSSPPILVILVCDSQVTRCGSTLSRPNRRSPPYVAGGVSTHGAGPSQSRRSSDDYATPPTPVPAPFSPLLFRRGRALGRSRNVPTPGRTVQPRRALTAPSSPAACRSARQQGGIAAIAATGLHHPGQQGVAEDARALQLLAEVVDKLQGLMASHAPLAPPSPRLRPPQLGSSSPSSCSSSSSSSLSCDAAPRSMVQVNRGGGAAPCRPGADGQMRLNNGAVRGASADGERSGCLAAKRKRTSRK